jgi:hypothetical protein
MAVYYCENCRDHGKLTDAPILVESTPMCDIHAQRVATSYKRPIPPPKLVRSSIFDPELPKGDREKKSGGQRGKRDE